MSSRVDIAAEEDSSVYMLEAALPCFLFTPGGVLSQGHRTYIYTLRERDSRFAVCLKGFR